MTFSVIVMRRNASPPNTCDMELVPPCSCMRRRTTSNGYVLNSAVAPAIAPKSIM